MPENFLGIEIGGTKLQVVRGTGDGKILERFRFAVDKTQGAAGIQKNIEETIRSLREFEIQAIGVGFGGPVNRETGKVWTSYHISGWSDFAIKSWLQKISGRHVEIDNDANVAALGEALRGAGKNYKHAFYVTLGSGVGSGLVIDGKIYHGAFPGEAEIGHIRLDKSGKIVEDSCSGWSVDKIIRKSIMENPHGKLSKLATGMNGGEATILLEAVQGGDPIASKILSDMTDDFSFALSHAVHFFHPEVVILGGGLSLIGEPLVARIREKIAPYLMDAFRPGPEIKLSELKEDAVPVGALALAAQSL
jgi:glucokinase